MLYVAKFVFVVVVVLFVCFLFVFLFSVHFFLNSDFTSIAQAIHKATC